MKALTLILFLSLCSSAYADLTYSTRKSGFFFGGGVQKSLTEIKNSSAEAQFEGWGYAAEAGVDLSWGRAFGNTISAEFKNTELINKQKSENAIEKADQKSTSYRAGFYFKNIGIGYGSSTDRAEIKQVSTTTGASSTTIKGDVTEIYLNYSLAIPSDYRLTFEIQKRDGDLENYKLDEIKVLMKFFALSIF